MELIPSDIIFLFFNHLSLFDGCNLALVSKKFAGSFNKRTYLDHAYANGDNLPPYILRDKLIPMTIVCRLNFNHTCLASKEILGNREFMTEMCRLDPNNTCMASKELLGDREFMAEMCILNHKLMPLLSEELIKDKVFMSVIYKHLVHLKFPNAIFKGYD